MTKKQYIEFVPLTIFLFAGLLTLFKVPYSALIVVISGGISATLYCPLFLWLYADFGIPLLNRILAGVAYSFASVAILFCFLHWANWKFECALAYCALAVIIIMCLLNYSKPLYRPLLWRCVFFAVIITLLYAHRGF
ncbi:hypothetical protein [Mucilaginibacter sp. FT3.2]|uniref:hypothetical protein n=1 Tax=Mucilaginibacter sp. FT3.2 TaxID=2723090 RepID=UPI00161DD5A4|nr:hypothetical protein [Mucilaginibacter sp. FT3.2]MBB6231802.1 hypothetical protein [Mucilaginibacter sp. FT3.2]